jgi:protein-disulfide isomerase
VKVDTPYLVAGAVAVVAVLGGLGYWAFGGGSKGESEPAQVTGDCKPIESFEVTDADYTLGKADAPVTMIEYASMTCPHCARFSRDVFPLLKENYIDKGYVRYVFREYPLDRVALTVSVVGRCLAKDAYIPFVEMMYGDLETWAAEQDLRGAIKERARRAGMSGDEFEKCLSSEDDAKKVLEVQSKAIKDYCINGTPTFLVNGKIIKSGEIPWAELDEKMRTALKEKGVDLPAAEASAPAEGTPAEGATTGEGAAAPAAEAPAEGTATPAETPATGEKPPSP